MPRPPRPEPVNTLWIGWLAEWREEASAAGNQNLARVYKKAQESLAACPIKFSHPCETEQLKGIGPKIIDRLETRLRRHCEQEALDYPERPQPVARPRKKAMSAGEVGGGRASADKGKGKAMSTSDSAPSSAMATSAGGFNLDGERHDGISTAPPAKKPKRAAAPKAYVPKRRSGGYAILIALYLATTPTNKEVFLLKNDIVTAGQPFSDSSFTSSDPANYYTAWSSMKLLIAKDYVYQTGNPPRFCLTDEGYAVAATVAKYEGVVPTSSRVVENANPSPPPRACGSSTSTMATSTRRRDCSPLGDVSSEKNEVIVLEDDDDMGSRDATLSHTMKATITHVYSKSTLHNRRSSESSESSEGITDLTRPSSYTMKTALVCSKSTLHSRAASDGSESSESITDLTRTRSAPSALPSGRQEPLRHRIPRLSSAMPSPYPTGSSILGTSNSYTPLAQSRTSSSTTNALAAHAPTTPSFPEVVPFTFPPGSYDVILVLDTREIRSQADRDYMRQALLDKGVNVQVRSLELGDALWIAKRRGGGGGDQDEVVLDYICERKRLDDLCSSIRDGRFHEQKFRLSNSGIGQVFYLVEDYNKEANVRQFGAQIQTALSSTQIVDGFFVHRTKNLEDTIRWLVNMTTVIKQLCEHSTLSVIPDRYISRPTFLALRRHLRSLHPTVSYLTTYATYRALNSKSGSTTPKDTWARMLLTVRGMSAEKASAVVNRWETPSQMWEAFNLAAQNEEAAMKDAERESAAAAANGEGGKKRAKKKRIPSAKALLADEVQCEGRRSIGPALSAKVFQIFMAESYSA